MCSDNVMFSTSSNSYPHGKLTCYDDNGSELERKEEGEEFTPGTTCVFLSTGHVSTGGFVIEMFCQEARWHVVLTELWSLPLLQFWTPRHIMSLPPNKKFHIHTGLQFGVTEIKNEISWVECHKAWYKKWGMVLDQYYGRIPFWGSSSALWKLKTKV